MARDSSEGNLREGAEVDSRTFQPCRYFNSNWRLWRSRDETSAPASFEVACKCCHSASLTRNERTRLFRGLFSMLSMPSILQGGDCSQDRLFERLSTVETVTLKLGIKGFSIDFEQARRHTLVAIDSLHNLRNMLTLHGPQWTKLGLNLPRLG